MGKPTANAFALYMPVLHKGYMQFFDHYPKIDTIYVFGASILTKEDYLRKDLRALSPAQQVEILKAMDRFNTVKILEKTDLADLAKENQTLVMPDEDISRLVAELLPGNKVEFYPVFLRWDRRAVNAKEPISADRTISTDQFDREVMGVARDISVKSSNIWRRVGAAIVKNGKVIAKSSNKQLPTEFSLWIDGDPRGTMRKGADIDVTTDMHAEAKLIANAARDGVSLKGASVYVTTFPCPSCAKLIAESGISRCYSAAGYAMLDGEKLLKAYNIELIQVDVPENVGHPAEWVPYPGR